MICYTSLEGLYFSLFSYIESNIFDQELCQVMNFKQIFQPLFIENQYLNNHLREVVYGIDIDHFLLEGSVSQI